MMRLLLLSTPGLAAAAASPFSLTDATALPFALTDSYIAAREARTPGSAPGVQFSGVFGDNAVLQRGVPAAIYGSVTEVFTGAGNVTVTLEGADGSTDTYSSVVGDLGGDAATWRVELKEHDAGGDFAVVEVTVTEYQEVLTAHQKKFSNDQKVVDFAKAKIINAYRLR